MLSRRDVAGNEPEGVRIERAADHIRALVPGDFVPRVGVVLGSGLGSVADRIEPCARVAYAEIPGFSPSTVDGHAGLLLLGRLDGVPAAIMQGRIHLYEGHDVRDVVRPVRVLVALGAKTLVITNAAGALRPELRVGEIMLIGDHLNLTGKNPLVGANEEALGPRFPDMSNAYDRDLRGVAQSVAKGLGFELEEGVYAGLLGPSYETPAEIRMLATLGADAVGMSTVLEVIAAHHMGARVIGLSCISNKAAGLTNVPLSHEEVKRAALLAQGTLAELVAGIARRIPL